MGIIWDRSEGSMDVRPLFEVAAPKAANRLV